LVLKLIKFGDAKVIIITLVKAMLLKQAVIIRIIAHAIVAIIVITIIKLYFQRKYSSYSDVSNSLTEQPNLDSY
jgi:uncharacterized membrane protein YraQ (UPF0718 family)